ncbi:MAG TPA: FAD-binding protein [bacterium]|nr:FAD-binding protein [bacterium]
MKLKKRATLSKFLTIRPQDAVCDLYFPESVDDIVRFTVLERDYHLLGGGSNVIAGAVRKPVITLALLEGRSATEDIDNRQVAVSMPAWVRVAPLIDYLIANGLTGLEFMAGIPGTVGGAIVGNAAPKGHSWDGIVRSVVYVKEGSVMTASPRFGYRRILDMPEPPYILLAAELILAKDTAAKIKERVRGFMKERITIPYPSAGSLFRNPDGASAGKLLEEAGCKGLAMGDAALYEKHANIVVNKGNARSADFVALREEAIARVQKKHGIHLEPEVRFWQ